MKKMLLVSTLVLSTSLFANPNIPLDQKISSFTVEEVSNEDIFKMGLGLYQTKNLNVTAGTGAGEDPIPSKPTIGERAETAGKIIGAVKEMVALGEAVYELVQKGKPKNTTEYAPISVVPKDPTTKEHIDPFDLEGFSMPIEKNFSANVVNGVGKKVVTFNYKVIYSYGGSYNGTGKYITNVLIIPSSVQTSFGWEFNASMKYLGMLNHGTKADPVAGVMLSMKYQMNSWSTAFERNDTIHITGKGELKHLANK